MRFNGTQERFLPVIGNEIKLSTTATFFNYTEGFSHYSKIKVTKVKISEREK